jgi:hypothetical protein
MKQPNIRRTPLPTGIATCNKNLPFIPPRT